MSSDQQTFAPRRALALVWGIFTIPVLAAALFLLVISVTTGGRLFALALIGLILAPSLQAFAPRRSRKRAARGSAFIGGVSLIACAWIAPGRGDVGSPAGSAFLLFENGTRHSRFSPATLVPEVDQQILGSYLTGIIDPLLSYEQSKRLRADIIEIYAEFRADENIGRLPSVMGFAYADLFLGSRRAGNQFVYIPEASVAARGPLPVVIFLHGSLGNFQAYWQILKALADSAGVAVVAPTFGAGDWYLDGGMEAVAGALRFCKDEPRIDRSRVHLAGLSNGGTGVTRAALEFAGAFDSLILISPVVEIGITEQPGFQSAWRGKPVRIISGNADKRVPMLGLQVAELGMREAGIDVRADYLQGADHFLFFAERGRLRRLLVEWLLEREFKGPTGL